MSGASNGVGRRETVRAPLPRDLDAEASILGGIILEPRVLAKLESLAVDDFYDHKNKVVFQAMRNLQALQRPIDLVTLEAAIRGDGKLDALGGPGYLGELALKVPTPDNVEAYADIVIGMETARRRRVAVSSAQERMDAGRDTGEAIEELHLDLARIEERTLAGAGFRLSWRAESMVELIQRRSSEQLVELRLGTGTTPIAIVRQGALVIVMGPTGAGKTSLAIGMLLAHEGPTVVLSRELPADEFGARAIGMQCDASWFDVLTGQVPRDEMLRRLPARMAVLDRKNATIGALVGAIRAAQREYPGEQILCAVDYIQILDGATSSDPRQKVAEILDMLDGIARQYRVVIIAVSQMSRVSSRAARSGDVLGAESTDGGAESSAIERFATATLTIGAAGEERDDGTRSVELNLGKWRMGAGDRVLPMSYCGRSGRWRVDGDPRRPDEVRAEREGQRDQRKRSAAELAIVPLLNRSPEPMSATQIRKAIGGTRDVICAAVRVLLESGAIVRCGRPRGGVAPVWTAERARAAGVTESGHDE